MAWNEPGDGRNKKPRNEGNRNDDNRGGGNKGEDLFDQIKDGLGQLFGGRGARGGGTGRVGGRGGPSLLLIAVAVLMLWVVFDSWVLIDERQRGVVLRFGKYERLMTPGPNLKLPRPFETVTKVDATQVRNYSQQVRMLTRDENIVLVDFNVQYQVSDPRHYLFGTRDPDDTLQQAAESAVREVMGNSVMDTILSGQRAELAAQARERLQIALDQYRTGLTVTEFNLQNARPPQEVKAAFDDAIKAREDKQRFENEALGYASKQVPEARGAAARIKAESEAYRARAVARAQGDADRFTLLADEYAKAPAVTRRRLYLETMQEVLAANPKVLSSNRGNNVFYLPLDKLDGRTGSASGGSDSEALFSERLPSLQTSPAAAPAAPARSSGPIRDSNRTPREGPSR